MTIWIPSLTERRGPLYSVIADALEDDVRMGRLRGGERLPTHRDLAHHLKVTVGTITRAYAEAERRGLVVGEVGRGTYVLGQSEDAGAAGFSIPERDEPDVVDLSLNHPAEGENRAALGAVLSAMARDASSAALLRYQPAAGMPRHRIAAAAWLTRNGLPAVGDDVIICNGVQHGMTVALAALCRPGDTILTEDTTYPGIKSLAGFFHIKLKGVALDEEGLRPDALEVACRSGAGKVLYCMPSYHNPTSAVMSEARRHEIAAVVRRHGVLVVEDDVYGFLSQERPPPLADLLPGQTFYLASASKCMAPGLRVGFIRAPKEMTLNVAGAVRTTGWMASPISAEIMSRWVEDGTADRLADWHRREARARQGIVQRVFQGLRYDATPGSYHIWLSLPPPWNAGDFALEARARGVAVIPADMFAVGQTRPPHAVRICLGPPRDRQHLEAGLRVLADLVAEPPSPQLFVM